MSKPLMKMNDINTKDVDILRIFEGITGIP
jgi:hypothetical protein